MADYLSPEERAWQLAYRDWWASATEKRWEDEHDLRQTAYMAWLDVPEQDKREAWDRYRRDHGVA